MVVDGGEDNTKSGGGEKKQILNVGYIIENGRGYICTKNNACYTYSLLTVHTAEQTSSVDHAIFVHAGFNMVDAVAFYPHR